MNDSVNVMYFDNVQFTKLKDSPEVYLLASTIKDSRQFVALWIRGEGFISYIADGTAERPFARIGEDRYEIS